MKRQIVIIGGGNAFKKHEEYINYLQTRPLGLASFRADANWKNSFQTKLGEEFDVLMVPMPNKDNARYGEWRIWFERVIPLLSEDVIFIGHSLGGLFLAKYLSENICLKKIAATFLLAAPFVTETDHILVDFALRDSLKGVERKGGAVFIFHSADDLVVPVAHAKMYADKLPSATLRIFSSYGHINQPEFPEIIADIQAI